MNIRKLSLVTAAAFATAWLPIALAPPAQALTLQDGCWVAPLAPYFAGSHTSGGVPQVYYPYEVVCLPSSAAMSVEVKTETWEQDLLGRAGDVDANGVNDADEDKIGSATTSRGFGWMGGGETVRVLGVLPHTDTDGNEEVYHQVQFRVTSGSVTGSWTSFELSQPTRIWW